MNPLFADDYIDMALLRRDAALNYVRRRHALRLAVRLGLPAEIVREVKRQVNSHRCTWTLLRRELQRFQLQGVTDHEPIV